MRTFYRAPSTDPHDDPIFLARSIQNQTEASPKSIHAGYTKRGPSTKREEWDKQGQNQGPFKGHPACARTILPLGEKKGRKPNKNDNREREITGA